jgi:type I restriction enzyme S subunit
MTYSIVSLRECIRKVDNRNLDNYYSTKSLRGVNKNKKFIMTVASTDGLDLGKYKLIQPKQFVYSGMQTGRDECIRVSLNTGSTIIVSPAYTVFEVKDGDKISPEYLMMILSNPEIDRIGWYKSDSSVRANLDWERFCEIQIPLPNIEQQREYASIYNSLIKLSRSHEQSFNGLQFITNTYIEKLVEKFGTEALSGHLRLERIKNVGLKYSNVRGISISKTFINPKANMNGVSLSNYSLVRRSQFSFNPNTARMGNKIPIAMNSSDETYIVSAIYPVFSIIDEQKLLPEFLLLWFKRPEFDRYARFNSWGSARETFDWSEMQRVRLPIPPISVQKSIVAIYHALEARKSLNERIKTIIKEISPVLTKDAKDKALEAAA